MEEQVKLAHEAHKKAFEEWKHGDPIETWTDENGDLCIRYASGTWWHYRLAGSYWEWW